MTDSSKLPFLLKLIDDDSPTIREVVFKELAHFGPTLEDELTRLAEPPDERQRRLLSRVLEIHGRKWLREAWPSWFGLKEDHAKLESAFSLLAEYQYGRTYQVKLKSLLDGLAEEYRALYPKAQALSLAHFLFNVKEIQGSLSHYYNPFNSNLVYVIQERQGLPISLVVIYMLVGRRLGLKIDGCGLPGYFLARIELKGEKTFLDCFDGVHLLSTRAVASLVMDWPGPASDIFEKSPTAEEILSRALRNLIHAYEEMKDPPNCRLMTELLSETESRS